MQPAPYNRHAVAYIRGWETSVPIVISIVFACHCNVIRRILLYQNKFLQCIYQIRHIIALEHGAN